MDLRDARESEVDRLAGIWHDGWQDGHTDAERRIAAAGADVAWLACVVGNDRAARFYEKSGWRRAGVVDYPAETEEGIFPLPVWRYEKRVGS